MEANRFDAITRLLDHPATSRRALCGLSLSPLAWLVTTLPGNNAEARRNRKHKLKNPKPNAFGCLEVGNPCRTAKQCCSGVCKGKKGKRTCRAHGVGTCTQDQLDWCAVESLAEEHLALASCNGRQGLCIHTTTASNACVNFHVCADCKRDADCEAMGAPAGSVCAPFSGSRACAGFCEETGGMACFHFAPIDDDDSRAADWR